MTKRIEHIDTLRELTMILVVLSHVSQHTYPGVYGVFSSLIIKVMIIATSLQGSKIIRLSPSIARLMLGVR